MGDKGWHREVLLVFFSTFEPISLPRHSVLQRNVIYMTRMGSITAPNSLCLPR